MLLPSVIQIKCHGEILSLQPVIPPKRFDIFPPDWEMLRMSSLDAFTFFLQYKNGNKKLLISAAITSVFPFLDVPRCGLGEYR